MWQGVVYLNLDISVVWIQLSELRCCRCTHFRKVAIMRRYRLVLRMCWVLRMQYRGTEWVLGIWLAESKFNLSYVRSSANHVQLSMRQGWGISCIPDSCYPAFWSLLASDIFALNIAHRKACESLTRAGDLLMLRFGWLSDSRGIGVGLGITGSI